MALFDVLAYCAVLAGLTVTPGPLTAILVAKSLANDRLGAYGFSFGIALGDTLIIVMICLGLSVWIQSFPFIFSVGKGLALVMILWVSYRILRRKHVRPDPVKETKSTVISSTFAGLLMCAVSPQTLLLYLLLVPRVVNLSDLKLSSVIGLLVITYLTLIICLSLVVFFADKIRSWILSDQASPKIDQVLAGTVALSGLSMIII